jgi:pyridoxine/pyridoxamine 5'-phosphate oxidase
MKIVDPLYFFKDDTKFWTILLEHHQERKELQRLVLSSTDASGKPQVRTMILRSLDIDEKALFFYTDSRSPKVGQWRQNSYTEALAYSHANLLQLRLSGQVRIIEQGDLFENARKGLSVHQHQDYNSKMPPGSAYDSSAADQNEELNFILVKLEVEQLEVLALQPKGEKHFRWNYQYNRDGQLIKSTRLVP